jgi:hypothetical protein
LLDTSENRIREFAENHNIKIYLEMPKGWIKDFGATTAPAGSVWIHNNKSRFSGEREQGLLIEEVNSDVRKR